MIDAVGDPVSRKVPVLNKAVHRAYVNAEILRGLGRIKQRPFRGWDSGHLTSTMSRVANVLHGRKK